MCGTSYRPDRSWAIALKHSKQLLQNNRTQALQALILLIMGRKHWLLMTQTPQVCASVHPIHVFAQFTGSGMKKRPAFIVSRTTKQRGVRASNGRT